MVGLIEKWAEVFNQIGNEDRLSIMIVLHGSDYLKHSRANSSNAGCLSFSQLLNATEIRPDSKLSYHLARLIEAKLVDKNPFKDDKGRVFPLYSVSKKWIDFATNCRIDERIREYIQEKYPSEFHDYTRV
jgi:DNA-binding transcriptional ArsR family regulator